MSGAEDLDSEVKRAMGWGSLRRALDASRGGATVKVVEFDGSGERMRGIPLGLRTLNADESTRLRADALRWLTGECRFTEEFLIGTTDGTAIFEFEVKVRTLALALVEPAAPHPPVAKDADDLRRTLDADEVTALFEMFLDWVAERSPITSARGVEEVRALCDALGKGTLPLARLSGYDSVSLRTIISELVAQLRTQTNSPSPRMQPSSDMATTTSEDSD